MGLYPRHDDVMLSEESRLNRGTIDSTYQCVLYMGIKHHEDDDGGKFENDW